jgi:surface-anchored protein
MKTTYLLQFGVALLCVWMCGVPVLGQGHCAKVSTDVTVYFGIDTDLPDPNHPTTVDFYHADFEVSFTPSGWDVLISHDVPGTAGGRDIPLADALLYGGSNSQWVLSSIPPDFEFIGAQPDEPFWILPQNAGTGALPLGFAAERADTGRLCPWNPQDHRGFDSVDRWFEVRLTDIGGPEGSDFSVWQADGIHPPVVFMSTHEDGIAADDVFYISAGSHVHVNWGFTQPGLYAVSFRISTVVRCDEWLTADWAPPGGSSFYGDGRVDFQDFAWIARYWLSTPRASDAATFMFLDPDDPTDPVDIDELAALADQWLLCGYPGCDALNGDLDPNDTN